MDRELSAIIEAIVLTLQLASVTTLILMFLAIPLAWWLARSDSIWRPWVFAVTALPVILPPSVLGFYFLIAFADTGPIGVLLSTFGIGSLNFSFQGLVLASIVYSLPFAVQPIYTAFCRIPEPLLFAASTLGAAPLDRFFTIVLPQAKVGLVTGTVLAFAHTIGEFGVVLMIGGNIAGETRVVSIAIYDFVETLRYGSAHALSAGLLVFSFVILGLIYKLNGPSVRGGVERRAPR